MSAPTASLTQEANHHARWRSQSRASDVHFTAKPNHILLARSRFDLDQKRRAARVQSDQIGCLLSFRTAGKVGELPAPTG